MAELPVIDTHQHLWDPRQLPYPEFAGQPDLDRPFLAQDYDRAAAACGITASICVEAASAGAPGAEETAWLRGEAAGSRLAAGVVAWAPVTRPGVGGYLRDLLDRPGPPVVGIRRGFTGDEPGLLADPVVVAGVRAVGAAGLPFELLVTAGQLAAAADLVQACPDTRFVLDHLGDPPDSPAQAGAWRAGLTRLAACGRVTCKLSGISIGQARRGPEAVAASLSFAIGRFGPGRVMFGSDWPVSTLGGAAGLEHWLATVRTALAGLSPAGRARALAGTAREVYGLAAPGRSRQPDHLHGKA